MNLLRDDRRISRTCFTSCTPVRVRPLPGILKVRRLCRPRRPLLADLPTFLSAPRTRMSMNAELAREQMIDQQLRTWEVLDERVLQAMREVRRENFVPAAFRDLAFADAFIPLGHRQSMLPPRLDGRILQALELRSTDIVLDIGSGSGFLAACLGRLSGRVRSLEIVPELAQIATKNLLDAAVNNVAVEIADATRLQQDATFDAIAITASLPLYDERFQRALRIGGRMFVVVGNAPVMEAVRITRTGEREWLRESLFETVIDPMLNAARPPAFIF